MSFSMPSESHICHISMPSKSHICHKSITDVISVCLLSLTHVISVCLLSLTQHDTRTCIPSLTQSQQHSERTIKVSNISQLTFQDSHKSHQHIFQGMYVPAFMHACVRTYTCVCLGYANGDTCILEHADFHSHQSYF